MAASSTKRTSSMVCFDFELEIVDLLLVDQDIFALLVFVALGDLLVLDRADAGRDLLVADALAGGLVDLVEGDGALGGGRRVEPDRDVDQGKPQMAGPERARCHTRNSSKQTRTAKGPWPAQVRTTGPNPCGSRENPHRPGSCRYLIAIFLKHALDCIGDDTRTAILACRRRAFPGPCRPKFEPPDARLATVC